mgnify:CR=1 FL=1
MFDAFTDCNVEIVAATLKDMLVEQFNVGVAEGAVKQGQVLDPTNVPADTLKQMIVMNHFSLAIDLRPGIS